MAKWTFEQKAAIDIRNANLLISAAAGSGKTAVLVERITQLIQRKEVEIHNMLIVTYTNAAASEMRGRIEVALSNAIENSTESAPYLNEQIKLLNRASIKTFHAFCLDVIRNHFQRIDCDPSFKMLSEPERDILIRQAIEMVLERYFEAAQPGFLELVEAYSGNRNDEKLIQMVLQLFGFIQSQPKPLAWLEHHKMSYASADHPMRRKWMEMMRLTFIDKLDGALDLLEYGIELCASPGGPEAYIPTLESDIRGIQGIIDGAENLETFAKAVEAFKFDRIALIKKEDRALYDDALVEEVKEVIRNKGVKDHVFEPIKTFFGYKSMMRYQSELDALYEKVDLLYQLTSDFSVQFKALKKKKNVMDFNDLEHYAIDILDDDAIAQSYRDKFDYIFVDEYQDSSGIQEHIVKKICRQNNVFMVGDVKQSIYKFRLADPELFIGKYKSYVKLDDLVEPAVRKDIEDGSLSAYEDVLKDVQSQLDEPGKTHQVRIDLRKNFRTRGDILKRVNNIFENIMSEKLGEINYDVDARLYAGMAFDEAKMPFFEVNVISKKSLGEASDDREEPDEILKTEELEANAIASAIKNRIGTQIFDPKNQVYKPCQFKDIVVLIRSSKSWTPTFEQVFMEQGVPLYADSNAGYFDTLEIKFVVALMQIVDNPLQDLSVLTILRSPMVQLSIEDIVTLKMVSDEKRHFYHKCLQYLECDSEDHVLKMKISRFVALIETLRSQSRYLPLDEWVWKAIHETGFYQYVSAMPGGVARQANLKLLVERASNLKSARVATLSQFIEFIGKMNATQGDYGVASVISEEDNVVRLMSIHKSKGLEFPVVMLAGLGRKFNMMDAQGDLMLHKHLGMGLSAVDTTLRTKSKTLPQFVIRDQIKTETLSEEMRVLYVALTRPVDQLVLFATVSDYEAKIKKWGRKTDHLSLTTATGFIDWIMPTAIQDAKIKLNVLDQDSIATEAISAETTENKYIHKWQRWLELSQIQPLDVILKEFETTEAQDVYNEINRRLSFELKGIETFNKPVKITVSDKKKELLDEHSQTLPILVEVPQFMKTQMPMASAEIGTAIHAVLERIDLNMPVELKAVQTYLIGLTQKNILSERQMEVIDPFVILNFLSSELVHRVRHSLQFKRETPFVLKMEQQYIQGIIDLYFEESDGLVLVDYKSDKVPVSKEHYLKERYGTQLDIYEKALSELTQKPVKEIYIYLTDRAELLRM